MDTLFNLDELPVKPAATAPNPTRYYLVREFNDWHTGNPALYAMRELHTNGGPDWMPVAKLSRRTPHLYKTLAGAKRAAADYGAEVRVWEGKRR